MILLSLFSLIPLFSLISFIYILTLRNKYHVSIQENGLSAIYCEKELKNFIVRSNYTISRSIGIYYFEVEIIKIKEDV